VCILESVWEPPAEGFLSVAEQEADESTKGKDSKGKDKAGNKKKAPATGSKAKRKKTTDKKDDDDDGDEDAAEDPSQPPVRGEFEPFMAETTRIGSWRTVEKM